jgi:hypothetical protein
MYKEFKTAAEYEPNDLALMTTNFQTFFLFLFDTANNNLPKDNGFTIRATIGPVSAEIIYTPHTATAETTQPQIKTSRKVSIDDIIAEYPDFLEFRDTGNFIGTKKKK